MSDIVEAHWPMVHGWPTRLLAHATDDIDKALNYDEYRNLCKQYKANNCHPHIIADWCGEHDFAHLEAFWRAVNEDKHLYSRSIAQRA